MTPRLSGLSAAPVLNTSPGETVWPAELVATTRTWYVWLGSRPVTRALTALADVPAPTDRATVCALKLVVVPYWNCTVVVLPFGLTVPVSTAV